VGIGKKKSVIGSKTLDILDPNLTQRGSPVGAELSQGTEGSFEIHEAMLAPNFEEDKRRLDYGSRAFHGNLFFFYYLLLQARYSFGRHASHV